MKKLLFLFIYFFFIISIKSSYGQSDSQSNHISYVKGGIVRGDSTLREVYLVFTADSEAEGMPHILKVLKKEKLKAGFFFTGNYFRNPDNHKPTKKLIKHNHYLGPHSDEHLLYCSWDNRDLTLVSKDSFTNDLLNNIKLIEKYNANLQTKIYIPPYEWWNDTIAAWSKEAGWGIINFTPGIRTNADYTTPDMNNYRSSEWIMKSLKELYLNNPSAFNGAIILVHAGTNPLRTDKLYHRLGELIRWLKSEGFEFKPVTNLTDNSVK